MTLSIFYEVKNAKLKYLEVMLKKPELLKKQLMNVWAKFKTKMRHFCKRIIN